MEIKLERNSRGHVVIVADGKRFVIVLGSWRTTDKIRQDAKELGYRESRANNIPQLFCTAKVKNLMMVMRLRAIIVPSNAYTNGMFPSVENDAGNPDELPEFVMVPRAKNAEGRWPDNVAFVFEEMEEKK